MFNIFKKYSYNYSAPFNYSGEDGRRRSSQVRWSIATKKIRNLIAASDAISMKERNKLKTESFQQKNNFLDKFSTRDRQNSNNSYLFDNGRQDINSNNVSPMLENKNLERLYRNNFIDMSIVGTNSDIQDDDNGCRLFKMLFEPYSPINYIWSWILIMAIHYNSWIIIFRIAFPSTQQNNALWFSLDYTADFIYVIDILISSRLSFLENGIYVESVKRVSIRYLRSTGCALDIMSLIPLDILYLVISVNPAYRIPRLIKFVKTYKAKKIIESMTNFPNMIRGIFWLHIMFLLIHWNSCFYYIISRYEGFGSNKWVYPNQNATSSFPVHNYIKCMYWSTLVLTTIGESNPPETTIECFYMIVCYITGIFIFATIVGQAGNVIQNMNASRMEFEKQRDNMMHYMKSHNVPTHLQKRVRLWYDYTYSRGRINGGDDINQNTILPDKMKTELALHVHLETLRKVSFLQKCQPEFLHDLVLKMKLHIFTPGDFIVRKGEIAREMYVISDGIAEVMSENGRVLKVLQSGDFFGEIGLLKLSEGQNRRTADVRSCGYIELFVLSKDDVMSSIRDYPEAQRILAKHGRKRLVLGSMNSPGLRDETTSGSPSESEIEVKVTQADSSIACVDLPSINKSINHIFVDDVDENMEENFNANYTSQRSSIYLDTPKQVNKHRPLQPTMSGQSNVIGPASAMKHLDNRPYLLQIEKFKPAKDNYSSEEDDRKSTGDSLIKTRKLSLRRSCTDIRRKRRTIQPKRCTVGDSTTMNSPTIRRFLETTIGTQEIKAEDRSIQREASEINPKKQQNTAHTNNSSPTLDHKCLNYENEKVLIEKEELKKEIHIKETEVCKIYDKMKEKEKELKDKEEEFAKKLECMEVAGEDLRKRLETMESIILEQKTIKEKIIHL